jgi:transposase
MKQTPTSPYAPDIEELRAWLKTMVAAMKLVELIAAVLALITRMRDINLELTKRVAHLTRKRPRSETLERLERQLVLPLPGLNPAAKPVAKSPDPDEKKRRRRGGGGRGAFPAHLPRVDLPNPVPEDLRTCPLCGARMATVAHSVCETINVVPARFFIERRIDETVACPNDDTIVSAPTPPAIVERGKLGDTLITEATCDKFIEHQPIERQCLRFARTGIDIAPQTLARSVAAHIDLLMPIAELIAARTRAPGYLGTDATGIPILDPTITEGIRTGAMWCWTNARWVSFFYAAHGNTQSVRDFLGENLARNVQCDGTPITNCIERAGGKRPGCMAHARRRFVEAAREGDSIALEGLRLIAPLFAVERASAQAGDTAEERLARRQRESVPIIQKLRDWLDDKRGFIPPKTSLGRALRYLHRQWPRLILFLEDGNIELTNNRRERELRRLILGRKNWLFTWLDSGGKRTAAILTIIATCIAHDLNPRAYLHLVTQLIVHGWPQKMLRELLPDRIAVARPDLCVAALDEPSFVEPAGLLPAPT